MLDPITITIRLCELMTVERGLKFNAICDILWNQKYFKALVVTNVNSVGAKSYLKLADEVMFRMQKIN
jgi:hypothetical protein